MRTEYSISERVNDILDKISKYGMKSITKLEKEFLDSYSIGKENETHNKINKDEYEFIFEDEDGYFKFELIDIVEFEDEKHYNGVIYVPDIILKNKKIEGRLEGNITVYLDGTISPDFYLISKKTIYDIFEFCEGLEYELDNFVDYIIKKIERKI